MGQAKLRGNKEQRIAKAVDAAKTRAPQKKLNKGQLRTLAFQIACETLGRILTSR